MPDTTAGYIKSPTPLLPLITEVKDMGKTVLKNLYSSLDFGLMVLGGAMRYVLFDAKEHSKLGPFDVGGGVHLHMVNAFSPDLVAYTL